MQQSPRFASSLRFMHIATLGAFAFFSACVPILGIDEPVIAENTECKTFTCVDGTCTDRYAPFGAPCETSMMCDGNGACKMTTNGACTGNVDCLSNICSANECKLDTLGTCANATECASGICYDDKCRLFTGESCADEAECTPGLCVDGICKLTDGSGCDLSSECASGACIGTICHTSDGGTCSVNADCASGRCDGMHCDLSMGKPCQSNDECASNECLDLVCVAQSCAGLNPICGPNQDESCCDAPIVTGGSYSRSNNVLPPAPATISDFRLDRFEVTVARFRRFVETYPESKPSEGAGQHPIIVGSAWNPMWDMALPMTKDDLKNALISCGPESTWAANPGPADRLPINCIDWYLAFAFCAWDGGRLPTEAEWNYAAAGGDEQRVYPWTKPLTIPFIDASFAVYNCEGMGNSNVCGIEDILPVGSRSAKGDGRWQQADLAGSVSEWTLDWFQPNYSAMCINCAVVTPAQYRVRRGGSWITGPTFVTTDRRRSEDPITRLDDVGIRCARSSQ